MPPRGFGNTHMTSRRSIHVLSLLLAAVSLSQAAPARKTVNIAYVEPGRYFQHDRYYTAVKDELAKLVPPDIALRYDAANHFSADWDPVVCRRFAAQLSQRKGIDIIVAAGPWVMGNLLESGADIPIVGIFQPWQVTRNLDQWADSSLPFAYVSDSAKISRDLTSLAGLTGARKIGFLWFQSDSADTLPIAEARRAAPSLGVDIIPSLGYTPRGLYAYFLAYNGLPKDIDALYIGPLWGLDAEAITELMRAAVADRIPTFPAEDHMAVSRGAFGTNAMASIQPLARLHAWQIAQIIQGTRPASVIRTLPVLPLTTINEQTRITTNVRLTEEQACQSVAILRMPEPTAALFTLREAIVRGHQAQPGIVALEEGGAVRFAGSGWRGPDLRMSGSISRIDRNAVQNSGSLLDRTLASARLEAYQPLLAPVQRNVFATLEHDRDAQAKRELVRGIVDAYSRAIEVEQQLEALERLRTALTEWLAIAELHRVIDSRTEREKRRWQAVWLDLTADKVEFRAASKIAQARLAYALGYPQETVFALDTAGQSETHALARAGDWYELLATDSLLDVQSARLSDQAIATVKRAGFTGGYNDKRAGWPALGLFGALNYRDSLAGAAFDGEKHTTWEVGARLNWSLRDLAERLLGSKNPNNSGVSWGFAEDDRRLRVATDVRTTLAELRRIAIQIRTYWRAREIGRESQRLIAEEYLAGTATAQELLESALHTHDLTCDMITRQRDLITHETALALVLGLETDELSGGPGGHVIKRLRVRP